MKKLLAVLGIGLLLFSCNDNEIPNKTNKSKNNVEETDNFLDSLEIAHRVDTYVGAITKSNMQNNELYNNLVQLEKLVGLDLTSAYSKFGEEIANVTQLSEFMSDQIERQMRLEMNLETVKSKAKEKIKTENELKKVEKKETKDLTKEKLDEYKKLKKMSASELEKVIQSVEGKTILASASAISGVVPDLKWTGSELFVGGNKKLVTQLLDSKKAADAYNKSIARRIQLQGEYGIQYKDL